MLVLVLECAPPKVVGYCSSWALQVATGVYVANLPAAKREEIWGQILKWADPDTRAVMVWSSPRTEQGLDYRVLGTPRRRITEREGLLVSTWFPRPHADLFSPE
jgi:CRISPR-associated endoribonuclease Cas2 subtype I-E